MASIKPPRRLAVVPESVESSVLHTAESANAITAIKTARDAAAAPEHTADRDEACELACQRLASGVPFRAVLAEMWRAGYVTGHLDAQDDARQQAAHQQLAAAAAAATNTDAPAKRPSRSRKKIGAAA